MRRCTVIELVLCVGFICLAGFVQPAPGAQRTALVIGNSKYEAAVLLKNPGNDALDMAEALKDLGFEVISKVDARREEMDTAVQNFFRNLNSAQAGFFYYAGHGMQINGVNYLLPVDIQVSSPADVKHRAIKTDWILAKMEDSGSKVNIVVLDACRDNPFRGLRGAGDGLAPIQSVRGSFIAYATSPGSVARDGAGRNGLYTTHLLRNMKRQGLMVEEVFREVRRGVAEETNNEQIPWDSSSLMGAFYIAGKGSGGDDVELYRFQEEQGRLERERRDLQKLKPEIEKMQREAQSQKADVASISQKPLQLPIPTLTIDNEIGREGGYVAYANGVVRDTETGLEWVAGPDKNTSWMEAKFWVQGLELDGGGWRIPTELELKSLYKNGLGSRNMTPLLKTTGWWVWSGEEEIGHGEATDSFSKPFYFYGDSRWIMDPRANIDGRVFAVRHRSAGG